MRSRSLSFAVMATAIIGVSCESAPADPHLENTNTLYPMTKPASYFGLPLTETADISLNYDADTTGLLVYAQGGGALTGEERLLFVSRLIAPDGTALVDASSGGDVNTLVARRRPITPDLNGTDGVVSFAMPEADGPELPRGKYTLRLAGSVSSVQVHIARRVKENASAGSVDLNLFFIKGTGMQADNSIILDPAIDAFYELMAKGGISRGKVIRYDIDGADASKFVAINAQNEALPAPLRQLMLKAGLASNTRAINAFFTRELDSNDGLGTILGISLGIPAALTCGATPNSGVVVSLSGHQLKDGSYDTRTMGRTIAHEAAHGMGLFHTTEAPASNNVHDIISDTPECPASADADKNGILDPQECAKYDAADFMFWESSEGTVLTPQQSAVLLHSVVVRGAGE